PTLDRRAFLKASGLVAGGFMLRWDFLPAARAGEPAAPVALNAWIKITPDNWTTIVVSQAEMGQGIETTMSATIADELGADWALVRRENSPAAPAYQNPNYHWQFTGNAESTRTFYFHTRTVAAAAREMFAAAAAAKWGVPAGSLRVEKSFVFDDAGQRRASFGELASAAAALPAPAKPRLKNKNELKLIGGVSLPRVDVPAKVDGSAVFGIDVVVPRLAHAAVLFPRAIGAKIATVDDAVAKALPGVIAVVPLGDAVVVVAEKFWQATRAVAALKVDWTPPAAGHFDSASFAKLYADAFAGKPFENVVHEGDAAAVLDAAPAANRVEVDYHSGWQIHAPLEPMNCTAHVEGDRCTLWAPTQGQEMCQIVIHYALGIPKENVTVNRTYLGGGFGRRLLGDYAVLAALSARAVGRPVKLIWSREMDARRSQFRPAFDQRARATLGAEGFPTALECRLVAPTILKPVSPGPFPNPKIDPLCVETLNEIPYGIENLRVDFHLLDVPVPTMVLRTTGAGPNVFFLESFIDELAHRAKADPYRYRRALLEKKPGNERLLAVLDLAAEKGGMKNPTRDGRFRGIACCGGFGSFLAQVVEISVARDLVIDLHRVVSVVDCGQVLDPGIASASIAGGVVWGLGQALATEATFTASGITEENFDGFRLLTLPETPPNEIHFIDGGGALGGIGEVGPLCVIPALANAVFAATGRRLRSLPFNRHGLQLRKVLALS
ncbi:MAG: molybdopterin cofactor-binding domain-containing protein, partial [Opitutaceae bacterium]